MGDFFSSGTMNPNYQQMPGTLGAAVASQGIKSNAQIAMQQAEMERQKLGLLSQQNNQQNNLEQQKLNILARQGDAQNMVAQQNADTLQANQQIQMQEQQYKQQQEAKDAELMGLAGKAFQAGDMKTWANIIAQKDPKLATTVMKNMQDIKTSMSTQTKNETDNEKSQLALMQTKAQMISPLTKQLATAQSDEQMKDIYNKNRGLLRSAGVDLGDNPTHDQMVALAGQVQSMTAGKPASGEAAKVGMNSAMVITGLKNIQKYAAEAGNDPALLKAEWIPNYAGKDTKYQIIDAAANMISSATDNLMTGASVQPEQHESYKKFQIKPGDTLETILWKAKMLKNIVGGNFRLMQINPGLYGLDEKDIEIQRDDEDTSTASGSAPAAAQPMGRYGAARSIR